VAGVRRRIGARISAELIEQSGEGSVAADGDLALEALEDVRAPLAKVHDLRRHAVRVEARAEHVERRREQLRRHALDEECDRAVGGEHLPGAVDHQRGIGLVAVEHEANRVAYRRHLRVVEGVLLEDGRIAGRQEQTVPLAKGHLEPLGEVEDHVGARP